VEFRVEIGEDRSVVRVPRRVFQRLLPERPTPERSVEAYYLQRTRFESVAARKPRRRQLTEDGNVEISGLRLALVARIASPRSGAKYWTPIGASAGVLQLLNKRSRNRNRGSNSSAGPDNTSPAGNTPQADSRPGRAGSNRTDNNTG
jgi:hypothetical protein